MKTVTLDEEDWVEILEAISVQSDALREDLRHVESQEEHDETSAHIEQLEGIDRKIRGKP